MLVGVIGQDSLWAVGFFRRDGDGADGEGGHGEHDVAQHGGVEADLAVVEPEVVLAEVEGSSTGHRSHATRIRVVRVMGRPGGT